MFRFLLKPRWIALGLFAVVMTSLCVRLGFWQLDRLHGRRYYNHLFAQGMAMPPQPVETLVDGSAGTSLLYRQAEATGTYDPAHEVILYGRTNNEEPGNHVLTPLRLPDGRAVIVDRGWVPYDMNTPPVQGPRPRRAPSRTRACSPPPSRAVRRRRRPPRPSRWSTWPRSGGSSPTRSSRTTSSSSIRPPAQTGSLPIPRPRPRWMKAPTRGTRSSGSPSPPSRAWGSCSSWSRRSAIPVAGPPKEMPRKGSAHRPDGHLLVGFTLRAQILGHATEPFPQPARHAGS